MIDESELEKAIRALNLKWLQADRKYRWMLADEDGVFYIKRNIKIAETKKKTFQRLPRKIYGHLPKEELEKLITRLNFSQDREKRMRDRFKIESAFISQALLEEFYQQLDAEIPTKSIVKQRYSHLRREFLDFFLKKDPNPVNWHRHHQAEWCNHLLAKKRSTSTLRQIVGIANRFMKFLHKKRPDEIPMMVFTPISRARFRKIKDEWSIEELGRPPSFINEFDFKTIEKRIPPQLKSVFLLCYYFGLRRSEAMGLYGRLDCIKKGYLQIDKQLLRYTREGKLILGSTKGRMARKVPYWYSSPESAYELVQNIVAMCPSDYTRKFRAFLKKNKLDYFVHDCRHSFITNAVNDSRKLQLNDIRLAAGHADLRVTNGYLRDSTNYDEQIWKPETPKKIAG
ncbi:MAG: hypothetical protein AABY64_12655 [Bdellovibrionota bacterium]